MRQKVRDELLRRGWVEKRDVLVRYSSPRIGWKPSDGTLIIGYREWPEKVNSILELDSILANVVF